MEMKATEKQSEYAKVIAKELEIDLPDLNSFNDTHKFLEQNIPKYKTIKKYKNYSIKDLPVESDGFTKECEKFFNDIIYDIGIYIFWNENKIMYIGKTASTLTGRVLSSYRTRSKESKITHISFIKLDNIADVHILEVVLITELKPILNVSCISDDVSEMFKNPININKLEKIKVKE